MNKIKEKTWIKIKQVKVCNSTIKDNIIYYSDKGKIINEYWIYVKDNYGIGFSTCLSDDVFRFNCSDGIAIYKIPENFKTYDDLKFITCFWLEDRINNIERLYSILPIILDSYLSSL